MTSAENARVCYLGALRLLAFNVVSGAQHGLFAMTWWDRWLAAWELIGNLAWCSADAYRSAVWLDYELHREWREGSLG